MKIVTIVKHVPDAEARVHVGNGGLDMSAETFVIDGLDEYGVEQALRIRESGIDATIVAVACGPQGSVEALRTALAMGADRALLVVTDEALDPISMARILAEVVRGEAADLVFVGGKQADWDSSALGAAMAEALDWPHSDWTTDVTLGNGALQVVHDVDDGSETLRMDLPAVITTQQGLCEPRYPTLPNIMKAKRKPLEARSLDDIASTADVAASPLTAVRSFEVQQRARAKVMIDGETRSAVAELVQRLRDDAKVL